MLRVVEVRLELARKQQGRERSGGIFVAGSLAWGMLIDWFRPDQYDVIDALICLVGVEVTMYARDV